MSLAREAVRMCVVRALRGNTWAAARVRDSEQGPIEDYFSDKALPEILVFTDDGMFGGGNGPRDLFAGGDQDLIIEVVVTSRMKSDDGEWVEPLVTDASMEFTIGVIQRQIKAALVDPQNAWAEMFRRFALTVNESKDRRGSSMRDGVRYAGRQLLLSLTLPKDPVPGVALGPLWTDFLAMVDADADLVKIAPVLRGAIEGDVGDMPEWVIMQGAYGRTRAEARSLLSNTDRVLESSEGSEPVNTAPEQPE